VLLLWIGRGGVRELLGGSPEAVFTGLGRLTGLLSAELFAVVLVMMARIPRVERPAGQDRLVRAHRGVGVAAVVLLLAHVVLVTQGYALGAGVGWAAQLVDLALHYPDVDAAAVGTVMLLAVALSSAPVLRRRQRYETWHLIHLNAYLGVVLSLAHETSLGSNLEAPGALRLAWWAAWAAVGAAVVGFRAVRPVAVSLRHGLAVDGVVRENADSVSVYVRGRDLTRLGAAPGQFFIWRFLSGPGWTRGHPYSLSAAPTDRLLRITVRDLGDGSNRARDLRPGTRVLVEGPYGRMHPGTHPGGPAVLIGCGIGITPLRAMLEELDAHRGELTLVYRASTPGGLVLTREIDRLAAARGITVHYLLGRRRRTRGRPSWLPERAGTVGEGEMLRLLVPSIARQQVYVCGPGDWTAAVRRAALDAGVPAEHVHSEFVAW